MTIGVIKGDTRSLNHSSLKNDSNNHGTAGNRSNNVTRHLPKP